MFHEIISLIAGTGSIVLLAVIIIQTTLLKKQISDASREAHLANAPYISPRFIATTGRPILHLKNVGRGSAVDVNIKIKSENGEILNTVSRFAFLPEDRTHNTHVDLEEFSKVSIEGIYFDISQTKHEINRVFSYPPSNENEGDF